jgi:NADPH-dependent 2,4-dienoyl-CoA reductase/sulfur reductase-like enzyme
MTDLLIIGGSDAGISAALRAKEIDPTIRPTVLVADRYPNFSICGLPFFLSGEVNRWQDLAHRTLNDIQQQGINLLLAHQATAIHPDERFVSVKDAQNRMLQLNYDKLIIATGAAATAPPIQGLDQPGVFMLRWMNDGLAINTYLDEFAPKKIVIIGAGYIGMEMADAMTLRGLKVTVVEAADCVLTTLDKELGTLVQQTLETCHVQVHTGIQVGAIVRQGAALLVSAPNGFATTADMVLVVTGSRPQTALAESCGIQIGLHDAICVTRKMETSLPHIFAAGDCAETWHRLLATAAYLPLGTTAHKQGRVAGENAAGGNSEFLGSLGTQVIKVFDRVAARTGLTTAEAKVAGFEAFSADCDAWDHKPYYPDATRMMIRITGDRESHHLLGAQIIGTYGAEISKRIDVLATAIYHEMKIDELNHLDLSYTPPLSSPWDPIQMAAQQWLSQYRREDGGQPISNSRVSAPLQASAPLFSKSTDS